ncbi:hypothetical protein K435DRAFT_808922 [Dendrothele bispora CBS 962.96]|uniref:Uncharacterized protein n=1 Tax=Dendrothele bispora (strain CBS 962.96) TaxID=1314807 RepID=A0A4S8L042_DENBC|nr:hypothetical protein K435DRAFT_808922 [Dendrothele bispora CBS 962.96]
MDLREGPEEDTVVDIEVTTEEVIMIPGVEVPAGAGVAVEGEATLEGIRPISPRIHDTKYQIEPCPNKPTYTAPNETWPGTGLNSIQGSNSNILVYDDDNGFSLSSSGGDGSSAVTNIPNDRDREIGDGYYFSSSSFPPPTVQTQTTPVSNEVTPHMGILPATNPSLQNIRNTTPPSQWEFPVMYWEFPKCLTKLGNSQYVVGNSPISPHNMGIPSMLLGIPQFLHTTWEFPNFSMQLGNSPV